jgi:hypothetical protein
MGLSGGLRLQATLSEFAIEETQITWGHTENPFPSHASAR